ncbi:GCN5-related N-acetyltransferase [Richelia sinica FACHB-800]|uniref:GCN5-related N-acetyltransferase n=1 Tax=Richelia sinica FACHB-800 TaxID=1357546 RepID=A0A975Y707_9NOST|nr:GNAT family N-acetyltransferase [Richelia sinica]MBD2665669.1 GNAT family N-acetyltransferase [Richelia sinica FACHB-800]QXE25814.1 GCN5-related N-acetyltransferase [Richelia sinica FACHB-800]
MNYQVVSHLNEQQILTLVELYQNEFWSKNRKYEDVLRMLKHSDIIIALLDEDEQLIGFSRILTDFVYRATLYDVIISPSYRNIGLGAKLLETAINHPQLKDVETIALYCLPNMIPFYQRWGFSTKTNGLQLMYRCSQ